MTIGAGFVAAWYASLACGQPVSLPATDEHATSAPTSAAVEALSVERAAARLGEVLRFWDVQYVDATPTVKLGDWAGYRVMLRQTWQDWVGGAQSGKGAHPVARSRAIQFVLFPLGPCGPSPHAKSHIWWRTRCPDQHTRPVKLGTGCGYVWLAKCPIDEQDVARRGLGLAGGDDPLRLLTDGLFVNDKGSMTRNSVMPLFAAYGDRALPYLERAIAQSADTDVWAPVCVLGQIRGERSTQVLLDLFESPNETLREAAAGALTRDPLSESGKRAYFEILRQQWCPGPAAAACVQYGWCDALPILEEVIAHPTTHYAFRSALEARRRLLGEQVPEDLLAAEATLRRLVSGMPTTRPTLDESNAARAAILESPDVEYAIVVAIDLALYGSKGGAPVNAAGRELLRALPLVPARQRLEALVAGSQDDSDRRQMEELLALLDPPAAPPR
jgi:hypothetical protein